MVKKYKRSFTLIEMLIVIVIIGILAGALIPRLVSMQSRARDTQRKVDLKTLYSALFTYYSDRSAYPMSICNFSGCGGIGCSGSTGCAFSEERTDQSGGLSVSLTPGYITSVPKDPLAPTSNYLYSYLITGTVTNIGTTCGISAKVIVQLQYLPEKPGGGTEFYRSCGGTQTWNELIGQGNGIYRGIWLIDERLGYIEK